MSSFAFKLDAVGIIQPLDHEPAPSLFDHMAVRKRGPPPGYGTVD